MRDTNFRSIPFNRASVSITAALYDKRALDCTSDRPLIYSLNHLIYLASSSARVRETLTSDGGIERLAAILRECIVDQSTKKVFKTPAEEESFKFFAAWKWTLAFQCMVFISTRGSEDIRRRVVSCGILPIIATVLKNYIEISKFKPMRGKLIFFFLHFFVNVRFYTVKSDSDIFSIGCSTAANLIHIVPIFLHCLDTRLTLLLVPHNSNSTPDATSQRRNLAFRAFQSPANQLNPTPADNSHRHSHGNTTNNNNTTATTTNNNTFLHRPFNQQVRNPRLGNSNILSSNASIVSSVAPSLVSTATTASSESDSLMLAESAPTISDPMPSIISDSSTATAGPSSASSTENDTNMTLSQLELPNHNQTNSSETLNVNLNTTSPQETQPLEQPTLRESPNTTPRQATFTYTPTDLYRYMQRDHLSLSPPRIFMNGKIVPCEFDIIWSLEILAFVSKYAYLREVLQTTHLIPAMTITYEDLYAEQRIEVRSPADEPAFEEMDVDQDPCSGTCQQYESTHANYVDTDDDDDDMPDSQSRYDYDSYDFECEQDIDGDFMGPTRNIFSIVELFTDRRFSNEIQYWAGVIMRNSCRRDDSKGGIRQCASFECGKWEEYPKQFAKCRRCKRTKYCSKQCQLKSWNYHRNWCVPPNHSSRASATSSQSGTSASTASLATDNSRTQTDFHHHHMDHAHARGATPQAHAPRPQQPMENLNGQFPQQPQQTILPLPVMDRGVGGVVGGDNMTQLGQMPGMPLIGQTIPGMPAIGNPVGPQALHNAQHDGVAATGVLPGVPTPREPEIA